MEELIGRKIKEIRKMTDEEQEHEGWDNKTTAIVLDDGTVLYASSDEEGNNAGEIFGRKGNETFAIYASEKPTYACVHCKTGGFAQKDDPHFKECQKKVTKRIVDLYGNGRMDWYENWASGVKSQSDEELAWRAKMAPIQKACAGGKSITPAILKRSQIAYDEVVSIQKQRAQILAIHQQATA